MTRLQPPFDTGACAADSHWQAWCDGTAAPNPGKLAVGVVIAPPDSVCHEVSLALGSSGCNNEAELRAIATALQLAQQAGAEHLQLHSDSRFAVDCINGLDSTEVPRLAMLLASIADQLACFKSVELRWLPRHRNTQADRLARSALGLIEKKPHVHKRRK